MDIISGIISLIKLVVGYLINVFVGRKNARNSQKLSNNEKTLKTKEKKGNDIVLTIDINVQQEIEKI